MNATHTHTGTDELVSLTITDTLSEYQETGRRLNKLEKDLLDIWDESKAVGNQLTFVETVQKEFKALGLGARSMFAHRLRDKAIGTIDTPIAAEFYGDCLVALTYAIAIN